MCFPAERADAFVLPLPSQPGVQMALMMGAKDSRPCLVFLLGTRVSNAADAFLQIFAVARSERRS